MLVHFHKYQGTGNDFILIDNRDGRITPDPALVARLCHRRFGIGADGLMLLEASAEEDFHMAYYNSDGQESSMCGNGGRCIAAFAHRLGLTGRSVRFTAIDGLHTAELLEGEAVCLHMQDVSGIRRQDGFCILNTGSPHYVRWVADAQSTEVFQEGRAIRNDPAFPEGINVNFVQRMEGQDLWVRTYERGVEAETLSCGTGVTAAAIAATGQETGAFSTTIHTPGGTLEVRFVKDSPDTAREVTLTGGAVFVFEGTIEVPG